jgi:uncharacterized OB-fold protein
MDRLSASRCEACGRVASPPEPYGCEGCGAPADRLLATELAAAGTVHSQATVHRHHRPVPATPFTVVEAILDGGPALKGVLEASAPPVAIGDRVSGSILDGMLTWIPEGTH